MLCHLQIHNFTLVEHLELELQGGLSVLTGETGAGKSILLGALGLTLGERADADKVRTGCAKAEVSACFDVRQLETVQTWLQEADLVADNPQECLLRRSVGADGRSRAFINGQTVTLTQLRQLGGLLIDIHSQHEHQTLLNPHSHRQLLDAFGQHLPRAQALRLAFTAWHKLNTQRTAILNHSEELNARYQLLQYQVAELDQLNLQDGELEQLEQRQKQLAHAETLNHASRSVLDLCSGDKSISDRLNRALTLLGNLPLRTQALDEAQSLLSTALINVQEAASELDRQLDSAEFMDADLPAIEQRLSQIYDTARKHRIRPSDLLELHNSLSLEFQSLQSGDTQLEHVDRALATALQQYQVQAEQLSQLRRAAAEQLRQQVNQQLGLLAMAHASLEIALEPQSAPTAQGQESVEFLISTIPGTPAKPLAKIASGGELSRISLAISVVTATTSTVPTLVFDEVDVGIGGETGDVVGRLLRQLGASSQVLCVTHLAQVASKAHQHLKVSKTLNELGAHTRLEELHSEAKIQEIARMMGGVIDSEQSLAHAREMVEQL